MRRHYLADRPRRSEKVNDCRTGTATVHATLVNLEDLNANDPRGS